MDSPNQITCPACGYSIIGLDARYTDKWGEVWVRESVDFVRRVSDGCIGKWLKGQGLNPLV